MTKKLDITDFQKKIYQYMRQKAQHYEGLTSAELQEYKVNQEELADRDFEHVQFDQLLDSINQSQVIYLGDFHTFDQSSKNLERLFRALKDQGHSLSLGIEFVHYRHQNVIHQFLNNYLTELEFLESIDYHNSWRFPWNHYRKIFQLIKKEEVKVCALNSEGTLKERDLFAANLIAKELDENPSRKILVLFGEYHISPNKLPQDLTTLLDRPLVQTIIHQNLDSVFWKMQDQGKSGSQIIQFDENEYSLQTSPPWVKYESMIYWFENLCEDPEFDIHEYLIETGVMALNSNVPENFIYLCQEITENLKFAIDEEELEDFNLYDHQSLPVVLEKIEQLQDPEQKELYQELVTEGKSFKLPHSNSFYCSNYSINRLSFLAGIHVHNLADKSNQQRDLVLSRNDKGKVFLFYLRQLLLSYFSSKIINPYRKCNLYQDIILEAQVSPDNLINKSTLQFFEQYDLANPHLLEVFAEQKLITIYLVARKIGYFLGDILYDSFYREGQEDVLADLRGRFDKAKDGSDLLSILTILLPQNTYKQYKKRFF